MKGDRFVTLAAGAASLAMTVPAVGALAGEAQSTVEQPASTDAPAADPASVAALLEQIKARVSALPADASAADIEAQIMFAIDQAQMPADVIAAALAQFQAESSNAAVLAAIGNVQALQGRLASGTGGTVNGGTGTGGVADSGDLNWGPSVGGGTGGGSSDYTPTA